MNARRLEGLRTFDRSSVSSLLILKTVEGAGRRREDDDGDGPVAS
jgi:hypothetical protein